MPPAGAVGRTSRLGSCAPAPACHCHQDVYSFGQLMYTAYTRQPPFHAMAPGAIVNAYVDAQLRCFGMHAWADGNVALHLARRDSRLQLPKRKGALCIPGHTHMTLCPTLQCLGAPAACIPSWNAATVCSACTRMLGARTFSSARNGRGAATAAGT